MERKNKKLIVIVSCLLLVISVSLAYYIGQLLISGEGATGNATTAKIKGATLTVEGKLEFNDPDILPGHKTISSIKVTATGNNELIPYNLVWKGTNGISQINYTVYKTSTEMNVSASCEKKTSVQNGVQILNEECTITNIDNLGTSIASGSIVKNSTKEILAKDEFITAVNDGVSYYYYVILEYPNLDEDQSADINATFNGEVTVEESNASPDINILAVYIGDETGNYTETTDIPQSGYVLSEKSTCSNNATVRMENNELITSNLTKSGTSCYLYFNKLKTVNTVLGNIEVNPEVKTKFDKIATTDEGIQQVSDGMYGGTSYYWRGASTTNYLKFGGYCWRIIRINGDGTIRLIYDGTTCHGNGTSTTDSLAVANTTYNSSYNKSEYVGWKYTEGLQRPSSTTEGTDATIKTVLENWYNSNLASHASKIADGKYCNDRNVESGSTWSSASNNGFIYAGFKRMYIDYAPTLSCTSLDTYILKVGLITADEVEFAGGKNANNILYYLYNGQNYWLMSPYNWGDSHFVLAFHVDSYGHLTGYNVDWSDPGVRPVINLKSDITISSGNGTKDNPYIVAD
jgi:hypothetical protein